MRHMASRTLPIPAGRLAGPACLAGLALAVASLFPGVLQGGVFFRAGRDGAERLEQLPYPVGGGLPLS